MHIVFVTNELATEKNASGGLASFTANMARIFFSKGHHVTIILFTTKETTLDFSPGIRLENVFIKKEIWNRLDKAAGILGLGNGELHEDIRKTLVNLKKSIYVSQKIREIDKEEKVDIVHYCNLNAPSLLASRKIPYVVRMSHFMRVYWKACERNFSLEQKKYPATIRVKAEEFALKRARYVISPSILIAELTEKIIGVRPNILESPFVLEKQKWNDTVYQQVLKNKKYVFHYGRLGYFKGTYVVAETVCQLLEEFPDIYVVMAGSNEKMYDEASGESLEAYEIVKRRAKQYGDRVIYLGQLVREELYPVIEHAQICWLPYRLDNLSNAIIEAMAIGTIVVGSEYLGQLIENGISGYLGEREEAQVYLRLLRQALRLEEKEKMRMIEKAKERIERLSPEEVYRRYSQYYSKVIREW